MRNFILILLLFSGQFLAAQLSNLVVYTEAKEPFTLTLSGQRTNQLPVRNLKVTGIPAGNYEIQIIFNNPALPRVGQYQQIVEGRELTLAVGQDMNGQWQISFVNEFSLGYLPIAPQGQMLLSYGGDLGTVGNANIVQSEPKPINNNIQNMGLPKEDELIEEVNEPVNVVPSPLPGYAGKLGCDYPMSTGDFETAKQSISSKSFSDTKMQVAKQITRSNCLLTSQVMDLMGIMNFEADKLEIAKFAYEFTYDQSNYYKVNEKFGFESSIRELEAHLAKLK